MTDCVSGNVSDDCPEIAGITLLRFSGWLRKQFLGTNTRTVLDLLLEQYTLPALVLFQQ
jgi:hypothetical protein